MLKEIELNMEEKMVYLRWKMVSHLLINSCLMKNINRLYIDINLIKLGVDCVYHSQVLSSMQTKDIHIFLKTENLHFQNIEMRLQIAIESLIMKPESFKYIEETKAFKISYVSDINENVNSQFKDKIF
jgi:hypothetical protein